MTLPVLRIRANGPAMDDITELSIGGVDLFPCMVRGLTLVTGPNDLTMVTITCEVTPDVEMPAELVTAQPASTAAEGAS